jgi:hypothetical protein
MRNVCHVLSTVSDMEPLPWCHPLSQVFGQAAWASLRVWEIRLVTWGLPRL